MILPGRQIDQSMVSGQMSWDPTWEQVFKDHDWGQYPPEDLIRFVARNFYSASDRSQVRILEVGCGSGANVWFLAREGFDVYGFDGSETAVFKAERRITEESLKANLRVGDAISLGEFYPNLCFDAVIDIGCLQHNKLEAVDSILSQVQGLLKPNGRIFSMLVASGSYGDGSGREVEPGTFVDANEGLYFNRGQGHFFTIEEVQRLFSRMSDVRIEYSARSVNNRQHCNRYWIIEAVKSS